jgi:hypothetical protein
MNDGTDLRELERHCSQLGEHFDSVRIIATTHRDGFTVSHSFGAGNFYAQMGAVREWIKRRDEEVMESVRHPPDATH